MTCLCASCTVSFTPTATEEFLAEVGQLPLPTRCRLCRLLRRTLPQAAPVAALPPPVVYATQPAFFPKKPRYARQPLRLYAEVAAWIARHDGRLPLAKDFATDHTLPTPRSLRKRGGGSLEQFYLQLDTLGFVPGVHTTYCQERLAGWQRKAAIACQRHKTGTPVPVRKRRTYLALKAAHLCVSCGAPALYAGTWRARCAPCQAYTNAYSRDWHHRQTAERTVRTTTP